MISPISFNGTYKVYNMKPEINIDYIELVKCQEHKGIKGKMDDNSHSNPDAKPLIINGKEAYTSATVVAPDKYDDFVEQFCKARGIEFKRLDDKEILDFEKIISRTTMPKNGKKTDKMVLMDVNRFEDIMKWQICGCLESYQDSYNHYYKDEVDFQLKSGENIVASTFHIFPTKGQKIDDVIKTISKHGIDRISQDDLSVGFIDVTRNNDSLMFYAMKNMGMKAIPVCVDENTYKIGKAMGLFG